MKYALLIYQGEGAYGPEKTDQDCDAQHQAVAEILGAKRLGSAGLKSTTIATTVRGSSAKTVHDGPFAETKEQLAGFYLIEAADLDEAIGIAKRVRHAGAIEIRPVSSYID